MVRKKCVKKPSCKRRMTYLSTDSKFQRCTTWRGQAWKIWDKSFCRDLEKSLQIRGVLIPDQLESYSMKVHCIELRFFLILPIHCSESSKWPSDLIAGHFSGPTFAEPRPRSTPYFTCRAAANLAGVTGACPRWWPPSLSLLCRSYSADPHCPYSADLQDKAALHLLLLSSTLCTLPKTGASA